MANPTKTVQLKLPVSLLRRDGTIFESELVTMLRDHLITQLVIVASPRGFSVRALPKFSTSFVVLIGTRHKEERHYKNLDRLYRALAPSNTLPPTLLITEPPP